jgi:hypothetical protein
MNVREYLCAKYKTVQPGAILAMECRVFGIPYPLRSGWLDRYGHIEITTEMQTKLIQQLLASKKDSAWAGLRVLVYGVEKVQLRDAELTLF